MYRVIKNPRRWAALLYPRRIPLFETLNKNALFHQLIADKFARAAQCVDRYALYDFVNSSVLANQKICYLEFGVWQGASIRKWSELNTNPESRFYGFDTFNGLPEDWKRSIPKGTFQMDGKTPDIEDQRVSFIKGLFQDTIKTFLKEFRNDGRLVIHIDCDLYSSTLYCLTALDPCMAEGSVIIFDEFRDLDHEFSAFWDYSRSSYRKWDAIAFASYYAQVAIQISGEAAG
jgi:O-methyltransferase